MQEEGRPSSQVKMEEGAKGPSSPTLRFFSTKLPAQHKLTEAGRTKKRECLFEKSQSAVQTEQVKGSEQLKGSNLYKEMEELNMTCIEIREALMEEGEGTLQLEELQSRVKSSNTDLSPSLSSIALCISSFIDREIDTREQRFRSKSSAGLSDLQPSNLKRGKEVPDRNVGFVDVGHSTDRCQHFRASLKSLKSSKNNSRSSDLANSCSYIGKLKSYIRETLNFYLTRAKEYDGLEEEPWMDDQREKGDVQECHCGVFRLNRVLKRLDKRLTAALEENKRLHARLDQTKRSRLHSATCYRSRIELLTTEINTLSRENASLVSQINNLQATTVSKEQYESLLRDKSHVEKEVTIEGGKMVEPGEGNGKEWLIQRHNQLLEERLRYLETKLSQHVSLQVECHSLRNTNSLLSIKLQHLCDPEETQEPPTPPPTPPFTSTILPPHPDLFDSTHASLDVINEFQKRHRRILSLESECRSKDRLLARLSRKFDRRQTLEKSLEFKIEQLTSDNNKMYKDLLVLNEEKNKLYMKMCNSETILAIGKGEEGEFTLHRLSQDAVPEEERMNREERMVALQRTLAITQHLLQENEEERKCLEKKLDEMEKRVQELWQMEMANLGNRLQVAEELEDVLGQKSDEQQAEIRQVEQDYQQSLHSLRFLVHQDRLRSLALHNTQVQH